MWFWPIFGLIFGITMVYESIGRKEYLDLLIGTGYIETDTEPIGIVIGIAIIIVAIWRIITILNWCRNLNFYFWKVRFYTSFLL